MTPDEFTDPFQRYVAEQFSQIADGQAALLQNQQTLLKNQDGMRDRLECLEKNQQGIVDMVRLWSAFFEDEDKVRSLAA